MSDPIASAQSPAPAATPDPERRADRIVLLIFILLATFLGIVSYTGKRTIERREREDEQRRQGVEPDEEDLGVLPVFQTGLGRPA